jgi:hypothetical protein
MPTITAVNKEANVPPIKANMPNRDKSPLLLGASDPIPPICIPIEAKLAKPHKIYVAIMIVFSYLNKPLFFISPKDIYPKNSFNTVFSPNN